MQVTIIAMIQVIHNNISVIKIAINTNWYGGLIILYEPLYNYYFIIVILYYNL